MRPLVKSYGVISTVAGRNSDVVFTHLARYMGGDEVAGLEFDAKRRIGQGLDDLALELNCLFF
jgi:hypothetical protein